MANIENIERIALPRRRVIRATLLTGMVAAMAPFAGLPSRQAAAAEMEVAIQNLSFAPAALTAPVGTTVRWVNRDGPPHTTTSDTGLWDSSVLRSGQSFTFTFTEPGTFPYHCDIHPQMTATITIMAAEPTAPTPTPVTTTPPPQGADRFASPAFRELWARTDATAAGRTYVWGPAPASDGLQEAYREAPGGRRLVQYFDKGRMELNQPNGPVTAGLLAVELISGRQQDGDNTFVARQPARVTVAGDPDNPFPTYADLSRLQARETNNTGAATPITKLFRTDGSFGTYAAATTNPLAATAGYDGTGHNLPRAFADFRNAPEFGGLAAIGLAITEPVWAEVRVAGRAATVLMQAFERRVLTYTPSNPAGFQVEYGNIGQAYYRWRYASQSGAPATGGEAEVAVGDLVFAPNALTVAVGTTVRWVNRDTRRHTTTSDAKLWDSQVLQPGQSFTFTFTQPGAFAYHCEIHPQMTATIAVGAAGAPPAPTPTPRPGYGSSHGHQHGAATP
jgi:plastocyanin